MGLYCSRNDYRGAWTPDTKLWLKKIPVTNPTRSISTLLRVGAYVSNPGPMQASALDLDKQCCLAVQSP